MQNRILKFTVIVISILVSVKVLKVGVLWLTGEEEILYTFSESHKIYTNPERGYYVQVASNHPEKFAQLEEQGIRLALLAYDLEGYEQGLLPKEKLDELEYALVQAQEHNIQVIFRAAYGFDSEPAEPKEKVLFTEHIRQIAQVLNTYKQVVSVVQAGMLGAYGEWHSGAYLDRDEVLDRQIRLDILQDWETYLAPQILLDVRRPRFIREAYEEGILTGRLGLHNDALLATKSDMGTYDTKDYDREKELRWIDENLKGQINGGEMPTISEWTDPVVADKEFSQMHIYYLNLKYNKEVIDYWKTQELYGQNAHDYLSNHLGYRLYLSQMRVSQKHIDKGNITLKLQLANSGYAPLPKGYKCFITCSYQGQYLEQEVLYSGIELICNNELVEIEQSINIPNEMMKQATQEQPIIIGLMIRKENGQVSSQACVQLANDSLYYENGINQIFKITDVHIRECKLPF